MNSGFNKAANSAGVKPSCFVAETLVMAVAWISKNLDKVVGPEVADDILTEGYSRELFRVKTSPGTNGGVKATTSVKTIDSKGYVVK